MDNRPGNNPADKQLVDRVLRGDHQAFGTIIKNTEALVAQVVFKLIANTEDRKDIAQDVYLKVFHKLDSFRFQSKLSTWIAQVAYNTCLSWLEKKKLVLPGNLHESNEAHESALEHLHRKSAGPGGHETDRPVMQKERSGIIQHEINNLPPIYQMLITLYHQEEMSYEEMAQITGLPDGTVKSYLFRARKMLKENLLSKYKKEAL